ncbi:MULTISPECIES: hypothetical protein [Bacillaceae]|uniref:hypothetical protein n=1 Tax=Bacillaceae TaxID=186817 RepID=UPI001BDE9279|nr:MULTISPECIES: hypothetical protein [Bacillaceae]MDX8360050.1 hypothetical protein [Cytobacillus sp. IB215316]MDX8366654.1 hypothetical protein [Cytobacillus sp. IB215665]
MKAEETKKSQLSSGNINALLAFASLMGALFFASMQNQIAYVFAVAFIYFLLMSVSKLNFIKKRINK